MKYGTKSLHTLVLLTDHSFHCEVDVILTVVTLSTVSMRHINVVRSMCACHLGAGNI